MTSQPVAENVLQNILTYFCFKTPLVSNTRLAKLIYLADVYHMEKFGERLTDIHFKHWNYGPWTGEVGSELECLLGMGILKTVSHRTKSGHEIELPRPNVKKTMVNLSKPGREILDEVIEEWGEVKTDEIIKYVKSTLPFVGTPFGEEIDFSRMDAVKEYAKEKGISEEEAATELVENNKGLMESLDKAREMAKT